MGGVLAGAEELPVVWTDGSGLTTDVAVPVQAAVDSTPAAATAASILERTTIVDPPVDSAILSPRRGMIDSRSPCPLSRGWWQPSQLAGVDVWGLDFRPVGAAFSDR
ncbi:hypothetical protein GCM10029964_076730 [Kibdelosporangium lantanae]